MYQMTFSNTSDLLLIKRDTLKVYDLHTRRECHSRDFSREFK